jgi:XTP/dITP diphosphohydrolase
VGYDKDIPETGQTLEENSLIKAKKVWEYCLLPCIADDTGLLVEALNNAPGVYSARFAGAGNNAAANIDKLLRELGDNPNRRACFETVIAFVNGEGNHLFRGVVRGEIPRKPSGSGGFGYDPVFRPLGSNKTFAQLPLAEKNRISHRSLALARLIGYFHSME